MSTKRKISEYYYELSFDDKVFKKLKYDFQGTSDKQEAYVNELITSICKFNQTKRLLSLLSDTKSAAFCMYYLQNFLLTAIQYKRKKIVDLLLNHGSEADNHSFLKNDLRTEVIEKYSAKDEAQKKNSDKRISLLIDAGLSSYVITQTLRKTIQRDDATRLLLIHGADVNLKDKNDKTILYFYFRGSSCFGDNLDTYLTFDNHLKKLKTAGMPLIEENINLFKSIEDKYRDRIKDTVRFNEVSSREAITYREECEKLKNFKLVYNYTLHDVLVKNPKDIVKLVSNEKLRNIIYSDDLHNEFPTYGNFIKLQYMKGSMRKALFNSCLIFMPSLLSPKIPNLVYWKILNMLDDTDLKNIISTGFLMMNK